MHGGVQGYPQWRLCTALSRSVHSCSVHSRTALNHSMRTHPQGPKATFLRVFDSLCFLVRLRERVNKIVTSDALGVCKVAHVVMTCGHQRVALLNSLPNFAQHASYIDRQLIKDSGILSYALLFRMLCLLIKKHTSLQRTAM